MRLGCEIFGGSGRLVVVGLVRDSGILGGACFVGFAGVRYDDDSCLLHLLAPVAYSSGGMLPDRYLHGCINYLFRFCVQKQF